MIAFPRRINKTWGTRGRGEISIFGLLNRLDMTKLSLCMIVKNEEATLPQCLESVKNFVDEMIVMDTGSADKTVEIAHSFGAKVFHFDWCNHFSEARNEALKYVEGDWVLVLDADEALTPTIVPYLKQAIEDEHNLVVNLIRHEVGAAQSPYSLVSRLFRNHPKVKFTRPYHSIVDDTVAQLLKKEPDWKVVDLPAIAILHYGYTPEAIKALDKYTRARKAMEGFFAEHPHDPYVCCKLGALYLQTGQEEKGIKLLKTGLKSNQAGEHLLFELHYHLGNAYVGQQKFEQAAKHYQKALLQPILPQLKLGAYNNFGSLLQAIGDLSQAQQAYEMAIKIDPSFAVAYYNLGMVLKEIGHFPEAISAYKQAIKVNPEYASAHQNLGLLLFKTGYFPESIASLQQAIKLHKSQNPPAAENLRQGLREIGIDIDH